MHSVHMHRSFSFKPGQANDRVQPKLQNVFKFKKKKKVYLFLLPQHHTLLRVHIKIASDNSNLLVISAGLSVLLRSTDIP